jgi:hypothetical protein
MSAKKPNILGITELEPWPEPVDGAALLNELADAFRRHLALPECAAEAIALWVLLTHTADAHNTSPRLAFVSPVYGCGKTTALSMLAGVVNRALPASNVSPAVIFRAIEQYHPTLLMDEADTYMHGYDEMRGILNSGHSRHTARVLRCEGENFEPRGYSTWSPVAVAKIGRLPDALESRSIVIPMHRRRPEQHVEPLNAEALAQVKVLGRKAARWGKDHFDELARSTPAMPPGLMNRNADNWRPLIAIADAAGGEWPNIARAVALAFSGTGDEPSATIQLLQAIQTLFDVRQMDRVTSQALCDKLNTLDDQPWMISEDRRELDQRRLAGLLRPFGIVPRSIRMGPLTPKGYLLTDFEDAFARYLPGSSPTSATPQQPQETADFSVPSPQHHPQHGASVAQHKPSVAGTVAENPKENGDSCGVAADRELVEL